MFMEVLLHVVSSLTSVDHSVAEMATYHHFLYWCLCDNFVITKSVNRNETVFDSL